MCVKSQLPYDLPKYFLLREKALEHWDYTFSDVFIHFKEIPCGDHNPLLIVSKLNVYERPWIEMHLFFDGDRKSHLYVIIEPLSGVRLGELDGDSPVDNNRVESNKAMFINIPELMKSPKMLEFVGVPAVIRLKNSNQCDCFLRESEGGFSYGDLCFNAVVMPNREACISTGLSCDGSQLPCEMIEGGPKTRNKVSHNQCSLNWRCGCSQDYDALAFFKVFFDFGRGGLFFHKPLNPRLKGAKMYLRPTGFELGVIDTSHIPSKTSIPSLG